MAEHVEGESRQELEEKLAKLEVLLGKFIERFTVSGTKLTIDRIKVNIKRHNNKDKFASEFFTLCTVGYIDTKQGRILLQDYANSLRQNAKTHSNIRMLMSYGDSIYKTQQALNTLAENEAKQREIPVQLEQPIQPIDDHHAEEALLPPPPKREQFESIALMLYPAKRKEIGDAVDALKAAEKTLKTVNKEFNDIQKELIANPEHMSTEHELFEQKEGGESLTRVNAAQSSVDLARDKLQQHLEELRKLRTELDKDKPLNQTRIQKILSSLRDIFRITGDKSLNLEIKKIESALDGSPKNLFSKLIDAFIKAVRSVAKFIANVTLDIKASIRNTAESGEKYRDTWVPNRFRNKQ